MLFRESASFRTKTTLTVPLHDIKLIGSYMGSLNSTALTMKKRSALSSNQPPSELLSALPHLKHGKFISWT
jgi:hypothetical protein